MKKISLLLVSLMLFVLSVGMVSAKEKTKQNIQVQINGVDVYSPYHHLDKGSLYVDVAAYLQVLKIPYEFKEKEVVIGNQQIPLEKNNGVPTASIEQLAKATKAEKVTYSPNKTSVYVLDLPDGVIPITPSVPGMGEHWANPKEMPIGPIYGVYEGKLVFLEQMIDQQDFIKGKNHVGIAGMKGLPSPSVEHTDIEFQAHGHEGMTIAHYDIHHYFVSHEEHLTFK